MALPIARPKKYESLDRVMAKIEELGLNEHIVELETKGYTTLKKVLSDERMDRARIAILDRVERNTGSRIDLGTATEQDFEGMTNDEIPNDEIPNDEYKRDRSSYTC